MKTNPEPDDFLNDVLSDTASENFRAASLQETLAAARRQKKRRTNIRIASAVALCLAAAAIAIWHVRQPSDVPVVSNTPSSVTPPTVPGTNIRVISDDQLLEMFPNRPVALVGPPGKRQLVFLDEQRSSANSTHPPRS